MRTTLRPAIAACLLVAACSSGSPSTSPPPAPPPPRPQGVPVATVVVTPDSVALAAHQSAQLTATERDSAGTALKGRVVAWASSATTIASVSTSRKVTAISSGSAIITATSEGRSGSAKVVVTSVPIVGAAGGDVTAGGGAIKLHFPAGAVSTNTTVTITAAQSPPTPPTGTTLFGTSYVLGPSGTTFGAPVTVALHYDPATLPSWAMTGDLGLQRLDNGQWQPLTNIALDTAAPTLTGQTTGFSTFGAVAMFPPTTITPDVASVNAQQRSVMFEAVLTPSGNPMAPTYSGVFTYQWSTTGHNGGLDPAPPPDDGQTVQYTAGTPIVPKGVLDTVTVKAFGRPKGGGDPALIGTASSVVNGDLNLTVAIHPDDQTITAGESLDLSAVVSDANGPKPPSSEWIYKWTSTENNGTILPPGASKVPETSTTVHYRASDPTVFPPPRADRIDLILLRQVTAFTRDDPLGLGAFQPHVLQTPIDTTEAFVAVNDPPYTATLSPSAPSIDAGSSVLLTTALSPAYPVYASGSGLTYQFTTPGSAGSLSSGATPTSSPSVTYAAPADAAESDPVTVEVFNAAHESIATAQAVVNVHGRPVTKPGTIAIGIQTEWTQPSRPCPSRASASMRWFRKFLVPRHIRSRSRIIMAPAGSTPTG